MSPRRVKALVETYGFVEFDSPGFAAVFLPTFDRPPDDGLALAAALDPDRYQLT